MAPAPPVRFAVITDVHANLPALDAALAAIDAAGCEFIVHTGDAIGIGPYPAETLDRLLGRGDVRFVMGNHDALFAFGLPSPRPAWASEAEEAHQRWVHEQLDPALRETVRRWSYRLDLRVHGRTIACCHYARMPAQRAVEGRERPDPLLAAGFAPIVPDPTAADLARIFADESADVLFYGHHHPRSDLTGRARYVNPGALGCNHATARYALVTVQSDGEIDVQLHEVPYERHSLLAAFDERAVPARDEILPIFYGVTRGAECADPLPGGVGADRRG